MALKKPKPVTQLKPLREEALELTADIARIKILAELTKFRFRSGILMIFLAVLVFFAGESLDLGKHFRPDFPDRAWLAARLLFLTGLAIAGKEIVDAVTGSVKSFFGKSHSPDN